MEVCNHLHPSLFSTSTILQLFTNVTSHDTTAPKDTYLSPTLTAVDAQGAAENLGAPGTIPTQSVAKNPVSIENLGAAMILGAAEEPGAAKILEAAAIPGAAVIGPAHSTIQNPGAATTLNAANALGVAETPGAAAIVGGAENRGGAELAGAANGPGGTAIPGAADLAWPLGGEVSFSL